MKVRTSPSDTADTASNDTEGNAPAGTSPSADASKDGAPGDANSHAASTSDAGEKPGATKDAPKPTLADVLKDAAKADDAQGTSPAPAKDGKEVVDPAAADATKAAEGEQDDTKLPFHKHPRWQEVIGQNKELTTKVSTLEPLATEMSNINRFMSENQLTPDEVGEGFVIMAMAKNGDPRVLQKLDEFRSKVALAIGEAVPADIQAQVDSGEITETAGKELAKSRAQLAAAQKRDTARNDQDQRTQRDNAARDLGQRQAAAVTAWEVEARKTDPDFAKKEKAVERYARAFMQERGIPKNEAEAVSLMKDAYAEVNRDFAAVAPQKQAVARVPSASSSIGAKEQPKSLKDAVRLAATS